MKTKFSLLRMDNYWRIILIIACLVAGGGLMLSISHLFPVFLDVVAVKFGQKFDVAGQAQKTLAIYTMPKKNFQYFVPYFSYVINEQADELPPADQEVAAPLIGIDFSDHAQEVIIKIIPQESLFNPGGPVEMAFLPGKRCEYGDGHACIYEFPSPNGTRVIFTSLHSGMGGEGESLRRLLEGTGFNQGLFQSSQVYSNTQALIGADVSLAQGDQTLDGLTLISITRIPPAHLPTYLALPIEKTLDYALSINGLDTDVLNQDVLVFETCGWRLPDESQVAGFKNTSNSVYLGFVGVDED